ncbi:hypothetical protein BC826DRAFT_1108769 [Russula brevipes]|nr:hypothetical protein BC826DRAFT_1108769 [Russula brevipes]
MTAVLRDPEAPPRSIVGISDTYAKALFPHMILHASFFKPSFRELIPLLAPKFRVLATRPARLRLHGGASGFASQLGTDFFAPLEVYWAAPTFSTTSPAAQALLPFLQLGQTKRQYTHGVPDALQARVAPEAYTLDAALLAREGTADVHLALFYDYRTNPQRYPQWQQYLRTSGVPVLALWGANDAIFVKAGAEVFARDVKDFVLDFVDSGYFALETHVEYFAERIDKFLSARILKV